MNSMSRELTKQVRLGKRTESVPLDLNAQVAENDHSIEHAVKSRHDAWRKMFGNPSDELSYRVDRLTLELEDLYRERRRLRLVQAIKDRTHEYFLTDDGLPRPRRVMVPA
jgi:hypothetical protein